MTNGGRTSIASAEEGIEIDLEFSRTLRNKLKKVDEIAAEGDGLTRG